MKRFAKEVVASVTSALYPSTETRGNSAARKYAQRRRAIERERDPDTWAQKVLLKKAKHVAVATEKQRVDQQRKAEAAERKAKAAANQRENQQQKAEAAERKAKAAALRTEKKAKSMRRLRLERKSEVGFTHTPN